MSMTQAARAVKQTIQQDDWLHVDNSSDAVVNSIALGQSITGENLPDPRPDITEDSELWVKLFELADKYQLAGILHGLRCIGTKLIPGKESYKLEPIYGKDYWPDPNYYAAVRKEYLTPHTQEVIALMKELFKDGNGDAIPG